MSWRLYPRFAVRATGFPVELLDELTTTALAETVSRYGAAAQYAELLRSRLLRSELPAAVRAADGERQLLRSLSRVRRQIGRRRPVTWTEHQLSGELSRLVAEWEERRRDCEKLLDDVTVTAAASRDQIAGQLARFALRPDVRGALLLLSPSFFAEVQRRGAEGAAPAVHRGDAAARAFSRRLALYLQRLAAKNETHSYFGPVGYGWVAPATHGIEVGGHVGAGPPDVFAAYRLAAGVGAAIEKSGVLPVRPRRVPAARLDGPRLVAGRGEVTLDALGRRLWALADGTRTTAELTAAAGDPARAAAVLEQLAASGFLVSAPPADPYSPDPLASVEQRLVAADHPGAGWWQGVIAEFRELLGGFAAAPEADRLSLLARIEELYRDVTGSEPRSGAGRMYADRTLLFEERPATYTLRLGGDFARDIEARAGRALSLWAAAAAERHARLQNHAAQVFASAFPGTEHAPFLDVLRALRRQPSQPVVTSVDDWMARQVARCAGPSLRLTADEVAAATAGSPAWPLFTSVDLLLARTGPGPRDAVVVIGEAHPMNLLSVFPTDYYARRDRPGLSAERDAWLLAQLTPPGARLARLVAARSSKIFGYPQDVVPVELRPHLPAAVTAAADLTVRLRDGRLTLSDSAGELVLVPALTGGDERDPLAAFSLPAVGNTVFGSGPALPRITVEDVVLQRRRWRSRLPDLPASLTAAQRYGTVVRWAYEQGMPRRVFAKAPGEPKPVYVDFASPVSADCLMSLRGDQALIFTEMLPDTEHCWLRGPQGRHACELRMLMAAPLPGPARPRQPAPGQPPGDPHSRPADG